MNCELIMKKNLLYEYADGTLAEDCAEALEAHLETCSACRTEEVRLRSLMAEMAALGNDLAPIEGPAAAATHVSETPELTGEVPEEGKEITDRQIFALKVALAIRNFRAAQKLVDYHLDTLMTLDPDQRNAARLVGLFGRWMDMGYSHVGGGKTGLEPSRLKMLKSCLRLFPQQPRPLLSMLDIFYLRMASGYAALAEHRNEDALADFSFAVAALPEMGDRELGALAHYGVAKVHRRRGEYDKAEPHVSEAIRLAGEIGRDEMVAGFSVIQAWIQFQKGDVNRAKELLGKAEAVLRRTKDHLRLGHIQSALGRIAQREGRYYDALRNYKTALSEYKKWGPRHGNDGRTLVNRAFVSRLLALRATNGGRDCKEGCAASDWLRRARTDLRRAGCIYRGLGHRRGQASVKVVSALLYLDSKDFDRAEREAEEAYQLGTERADVIVMARARVVQCMTENARALNSELGPSKEDACMERALTCAEDAITLAARTQNKRLQARTHIWRGLTLLRRGGVNNRDAATECSKQGQFLLEPRGGSYAAEELQLLEQELKLSHGSTPLGVVQGRKRSKVAPENSTPRLFADGG